MRTRIQNQEILRKALEAFERTTGLIVEFYPSIGQEGPDAVIDIRIKNMELRFEVEVKKNFTNAMIGNVAQNMKNNL